MSKTILGLDLGSNSIGWAVVKAEETGEKLNLTGIEAAGSRVLPMDGDLLSKFEQGNSVSQTATRRTARSARRRNERKKLRRARLLRALRTLGWLPAHMEAAIDDYGNIRKGMEPKMEWDNGQFVFPQAFEEMRADFAAKQPEIKNISHDWTIYHLRQKATREAISGTELAWVLMSFNQKRGYKASRTDTNIPTEKEGEKKEAVDVTVRDATPADNKRGKRMVTLLFDDGGTMAYAYNGDPSTLIGTQKECIKTTKEGKEPTYAEPSENDWTLLKLKTEQRINGSHKTVGEYLYDSLMEKPDDKLIGGKVTVVDRDFYRQELETILATQAKYHKELTDKAILNKCAAELYPNNPAHRNELTRQGLARLIIDDIILYQRPLKSKKSTIADCPLEEGRTYVNSDGQKVEKKIKCAPRSHPAFQEFRLWQFVNDLKVTDTRAVGDNDILTDKEREKLFNALTERGSVDSDKVLELLGLKKSKGRRKDAVGRDACQPFKVNMVDGKSYPCYETRAELIKCLKKAAPCLKEKGAALEMLKQRHNSELTNEEMLWHISYSVTDQKEFDKAMRKWAAANGLPPEETAQAFRSLKPKKEYAAYSLRAIRRLLPLMRRGGAWSWDNIDAKTRERLNHIMDGEDDPTISNEEREVWAGFHHEEDFQGLRPWMACMAVYGKTAGMEKETMEKPDDIDAWLKKFRHGSLRNPIVEQVVLETMRVVADVWRRFGKIDEIHIEMARELKKTNAERQQMTKDQAKREEENEQIRQLLRELTGTCDDVQPFSPIQQTKLKIYLEALRATTSEPEPSMEDIEAYRHWIEQSYQSPYTGEYISLARLFTKDYEIEHIVPRSLYYDDSFNNKVICEAAVNKDKGNKMAMEYIESAQGREIELGGGRKVRVLTPEEYRQHVERTYAHNSRKRENLLRTELPQGFNSRQMNDTRHIAVLVKSLLSNIVRGAEKDGGAGSKNVVVCTGAVTDKLKHDWGVNDKWNEIIMPRFKALDDKVEDKGDRDKRFIATSNGHEIPTVPTDMLKGFNKKRIDHRHHAMDAIVIACASLAMVNYISNNAAGKDGKFSVGEFDRLKQSVCQKDSQNGWVVKLPWPTFPSDLQKTLEGITVSIKHRERIVTKTTNHYTKRVNGKRIQDKQTTYAIRQSLHKDTVWGLVNLQTKDCKTLAEAIKAQRDFLTAQNDGAKATPKMHIASKPLRRKVAKLIRSGLTDKEIIALLKTDGDVWQEEIKGDKVDVFTWSKDGKDQVYATRFQSSLSDIFGKLTDADAIKKKIDSISDTGIQKILSNHLHLWPNGISTAFSEDGIKWLNENIVTLNDGKPHKPIRKVRRTESSPLGKQQVGQSGNKGSKFVEAAKGTNLFFAIYADGKGGRNGITVPLRTVIDRRLRGLSPAPETDKNGNKLLFVLSPNDLVYVPKNGERGIEDKNRIYKFVSCTNNTALFIPCNVAKVIQNGVEFEKANKISSLHKVTIKDICLPLEVDRLGNVSLKKIGEDD